MQRHNRYLSRARISETRFRNFLRCFALDLSATQAAEMTRVHRNTANALYRRIRLRLAEESERESPLSGEVELDESYFGPRRVPGKHGRGAGKKVIVFGLLKRHGRVYTQVVPNVRKSTLQQIIRGRVDLTSTIYSDYLNSYQGLVNVGYSKHYRLQHEQDEFARGSAPINGIESFWSFAKRRLQKFNGVPAHTFYLHLKECEWRFNHRDQDLYRELLRLLRANPL
jgi:transposase-like protein